MGNGVRAMELSPATFRDMGEEDLRTHLLVMLNSHHEGDATGETFNRAGKTDILIRRNDGNTFIGECKFWKGAKGFAATIDQLLRYTTWHDTKTAIIVFNRDRGLSAALAAIPLAVEGHKAWVRTLPARGETSFRFVLRHPDDQQRHLRMAVLVFEVPI